MGKYDADVKKAVAIGKGWVKTSAEYRGELIALKKTNVSWEKTALRRVQADFKAGKHLGPDGPQMLREIDVILERLEEFAKMGQRIYDKHDKWSLEEPRKNMGFIGPKLNLGPATGERYTEVAKAIKTQLMDVAKELAATQKAWNEDLKFSLKTQTDAALAMKKILTKESGTHRALMDQMASQVKEFMAFVDTAFGTLKLDGDVKEHEELKLGRFNRELTQVQLDQKLQTLKKKQDSLAPMRAQMQKNAARIYKSVPTQFGAEFQKHKKAIDDKLKKTDAELKFATKVFQELTVEFKKMRDAL